MTDEDWMTEALSQAETAKAKGEVPVGAIIVREQTLIATAYNRPIIDNDPTAHAEILALKQAAHVSNNYRLPGTTLYCTLEPCIMCAGAMVHARIERLVFAAYDPRCGAACSAFHCLDGAPLNHRVEYQGGVLQDAASKMLRDFFRARRQTKAS